MLRILILFGLVFSGCGVQSQQLIDPNGKSIEERFLLPKGYKRIFVETGSFQEYLRSLPLKRYGEKVRYYDGSIKDRDVYVSVVDMEIGKSDLLQCADAIIRLKAEYLYEQKRFDEIGFHITNGMYVPFKKFTEGYRVRVSNNRTEWIRTERKGRDRAVFDEYLRFIYTYAGTLSLSRELRPVEDEDIDIGDIYIIGGSPGHAVIIVDMAEDERTKEKIFLLAQSYMPAQEIQILKSFEHISPWYIHRKNSDLITPEWEFKKGSIKRFYW
ncbi:TPA: hypothetical protein DCX15_03285 [bacterium]|nr:hypothetical protein [bacterium]